MKVLVCGGRKYDNKDRMWEYLDVNNKDTPFLLLIEGGALGADHLAGQWAHDRGVQRVKFGLIGQNTANQQE